MSRGLRGVRIKNEFYRDCLQNAISHFMFLLTTKFVKKSHTWAIIFFPL